MVITARDLLTIEAIVGGGCVAAVTWETNGLAVSVTIPHGRSAYGFRNVFRPDENEQALERFAENVKSAYRSRPSCC